MQSKPKITDFYDYRIFLKSYFSYRKSLKPAWSYGSWAKQLEFANTSVLTNIILGRRNPGRSVTTKLINYFEFEPNEKNYFIGLVRLGNKNYSQEKNEQVLSLLKENKTKKFIDLTQKDFQILSDWYFQAIRELTYLPDFSTDPSWIQRRLVSKISLAQIKKATLLMIKMGILVMQENGDLKSSLRHTQVLPSLKNEDVQKYHIQMMDIAKFCIKAIPFEDRDLSGMTFNLEKKDIPAIKKLIHDFMKIICEKYESASGEETYQLSTQLFPLTYKRNQNI
jgi:uncharacterized protein (TIGR02147 family)